MLASIHQPSSRLYYEIDKLILLSEGHTLFYGDAHAAAKWLGLHGYPVPFGVSTADHLLDMACGQMPGLVGNGKQELQALIQTFSSRTIGEQVCN